PSLALACGSAARSLCAATFARSADSTAVGTCPVAPPRLLKDLAQPAIRLPSATSPPGLIGHRARDPERFMHIEVAEVAERPQGHTPRGLVGRRVCALQHAACLAEETIALGAGEPRSGLRNLRDGVQEVGQIQVSIGIVDGQMAQA